MFDPETGRACSQRPGARRKRVERTVATETFTSALTTLAEALESVLQTSSCAEEAERSLSGGLERHSLLPEDARRRRAGAAAARQRLVTPTFTDAGRQCQRRRVRDRLVLVVRLGAAIPRCTRPQCPMSALRLNERSK